MPAFAAYAAKNTVFLLSGACQRSTALFCSCMLKLRSSHSILSGNIAPAIPYTFPHLITGLATRLTPKKFDLIMVSCNEEMSGSNCCPGNYEQHMYVYILCSHAFQATEYLLSVILHEEEQLLR